MATKTINREKVFKIIGLSLFAVAILLALIGCFGDVLKTSMKVSIQGETEVMAESEPFTWLFKGMWDEISTFEGSSIHGVAVIFGILILISYFACLGAIIFAVVKTLNDFIKNKDIKVIDYSKNAKLMVSAVVAFIAILMSYKYMCIQGSGSESGMSASATEEMYAFGWGPILMIVGAIISLVALAFSSIENNMSSNDVMCLVFDKIGLIALVFIAIFGFRAVAQMNIVYAETGAPIQAKFFSGIFYVYATCFTEGAPFDAGTKALVVISLICVLATLVAIILAINTNKNKNKIVYFGAIAILSILSGVLILSAFNKMLATAPAQGTNPTFGKSNIINIVLSVIPLVLTIISMKYTKEKAVASK